MFDQVVWKDFVRMAQDDSRPEKAHKHISRVSNKFFGMRDFPYLRLGIRD